MILYDQSIPASLQEFGIQITVRDSRLTKTFQALLDEPELQARQAECISPGLWSGLSERICCVEINSGQATFSSSSQILLWQNEYVQSHIVTNNTSNILINKDLGTSVNRKRFVLSAIKYAVYSEMICESSSAALAGEIRFFVA